jgi:hypothetical protein
MACSAGRAAAGVTPSASFRSMRVSRPILPKRVCTAAISITREAAMASAAPRMSPATRRSAVPLPECSAMRSPVSSSSASCSAALRKMVSSASAAKRPAPAAGLGSSAGVTRASAKTSAPSSCSVSSAPARLTSSSTSGLAAATSGRPARSVERLVEAAARPGHLQVGVAGQRPQAAAEFAQRRSCTAWTAMPRATPRRIAPNERSVAIRRRASEPRKTGARLTRATPRRSAAARDRPSPPLPANA